MVKQSQPPADSKKTDNVRIVCPGCGLDMPEQPLAAYDGYFNTSSECWGVFTEIIGEDFSDAVLFGQAHQLTVDAYAVQHAGGSHPDKSVAVHLCGLFLAFEKWIPGPLIAPKLQQLAEQVEDWPVFELPPKNTSLTVLDLALTGSLPERIAITRIWAGQVWKCWAHVHGPIEKLLLENEIF